MLTTEEMRGNPATAIRLLIERVYGDACWAPGALDRLALLEERCRQNVGDPYDAVGIWVYLADWIMGERPDA